jgi:hypothetical protein
MIRNVWIYRRFVGLLVLLSAVLGVVFSNWAEVDVKIPFLWTGKSSVGAVMLVSAALGAVTTWLIMTLRRAIEEAHRQHDGRPDEPTGPAKGGAAAESGTSKRESEGPTSNGP